MNAGSWKPDGGRTISVRRLNSPTNGSPVERESSGTVSVPANGMGIGLLLGVGAGVEVALGRTVGELVRVAVGCGEGAVVAGPASIGVASSLRPHPVRAIEIAREGGASRRGDLPFAPGSPRASARVRFTQLSSHVTALVIRPPSVFPSCLADPTSIS